MDFQAQELRTGLLIRNIPRITEESAIKTKINVGVVNPIPSGICDDVACFFSGGVVIGGGVIVVAIV